MSISSFINILYVRIQAESFSEAFFIAAFTTAALSPACYLVVRGTLISLIRYFTTKRICKTTLKESKLIERLFFSKFKTMLPKHFFVINNVCIVMTIIDFLSCVITFATRDFDSIFAMYMCFYFSALWIASFLKRLVLGKSDKYSDLNFDAIYHKQRGRNKKRNKTRVRNPRKKK